MGVRTKLTLYVWKRANLFALTAKKGSAAATSSEKQDKQTSYSSCPYTHAQVARGAIHTKIYSAAASRIPGRSGPVPDQNARWAAAHPDGFLKQMQLRGPVRKSHLLSCVGQEVRHIWEWAAFRPFVLALGAADWLSHQFAHFGSDHSFSLRVDLYVKKNPVAACLYY
jgi:hypothetical protein